MNKKVALYTSVFLAAGLALTGCSANDEAKTDTNVTQEQAANLDSKSAVDFTQTFYLDVVVNKSEESFEAASKMQEVITEAIGDSSAADLLASDSPSEALQALNEEDSKKVADALIGITPIADHIDYEGLEDWEKSYLSIVMIGISSMGSYSAPDAVVTSIKSDEAAVETDGQTATIDNTQVYMVTESGGEAVLGENLGTSETHLKNVGGSWKIDGVKTLEGLQSLESDGEVAEEESSPEGE